MVAALKGVQIIGLYPALHKAEGIGVKSGHLWVSAVYQEGLVDLVGQERFRHERGHKRPQAKGEMESLHCGP